MAPIGVRQRRPSSSNRPTPDLDDPHLIKLILYSALAHFLIGLASIFLATFLGATITEAVLAVWELFCSIVGFAVVCMRRSPRVEPNQLPSYSRLYIRIYLFMTGIAVLLGLAAFIHGAFVLVRTTSIATDSLRQALQPVPNYTSWFIVLGISNLAVGLGTAIINGIIFQKLFTCQRSRLIQQPSSSGQHVAHGALSPDGHLSLSVSGSGSTGTLRLPPPTYEADAPAIFPSAPPPSYEDAVRASQRNPEVEKKVDKKY